MRNALKILFVVALAIPTMASALISNTKHNLTSTGPGGVKFTDTNADMCKFCHLVHDANTANGTLWARPAPTGIAWTAGNTLTSDGTVLDSTNAALGAGSQKCLSCHDGTVALNTVINAGGQYSQVALGSTALGGANIVAGTNVFLRGSTYMANLNGQHPVGIPFAGQSGSLAVAAEYGTASVAGCASGVPVCVAGATTPAAGAFIKLYGAAGAYQVECSSCHEPHAENVGGNFPFFLRVSGATVNGRCGACHKK
jgi:hypothetical protein